MQKPHDFDLGYLVKSPCRNCEKAGCLPRCIDECKTLHELQKRLSQGKSISSQFSPDEESALPIGGDIGDR